MNQSSQRSVRPEFAGMAPSTKGRVTGTSSLNRIYSWIICVVVLTAPIPLASHRPIFWLMWAVIIGALLAAHLVGTALLDKDRKLRLYAYPVILTGTVVFVGYALVQLVPGLGASLAGPGSGVALSAISLDSSQTFVSVIRIVTYAMLFALVLEVATNSERVRRIGWVIFAGVVAHAAWGLFAVNAFDGVLVLGDADDASDAVRGTFANRNSFATFLGMGICLGSALILNESLKPRMRRPFRRVIDADRVQQLVLWLGIVVLFLALLRTQSRMGLGATLVGLFIVVLLMRQKARGFWIALMQATAALIAGPLLATLVFGQDTLNRAVLGDVDLDTRFELYRQIVTMIQDRPLTGWGLDGFATAFPLYHSLPLSPSALWDLGHNTYLTLWAEMGLIVGSIPMILLLWVSIKLVRMIVQRSSHFVLPVAALGAITVGAVHSLVDFSLEMQANVFFLIVLIGLGLADLRSSRDQ